LGGKTDLLGFPLFRMAITPADAPESLDKLSGLIERAECATLRSYSTAERILFIVGS
jgi:hypothetical protein